MTKVSGRSTAFAALLLATLVATAGCGQIRDRQGYIADPVLVAAVQPGVDNRDSVASTLGRPTFTGQFDQREWYYVSRETANLGFKMPRPVKQEVLHIRFDEAGNVASVSRTGLEQVASIDPSKKETPTLGRDKSFFEELFGNIGQVGTVGTAGRTADNPQ
ncbi:MAG TPA: outer membrane protein assembly factor BamE [Allosphingosinicella sp.]|jgi:outer membrane protein assembly factor BamE (lipoprotein component of BamABCDE complex)|uniref:outer membrane protein assembly factor BamE n=1 Tax=Allosphingosinicella sp. TaxID=2823234 RepID=UPI002F2883A5